MSKSVRVTLVIAAFVLIGVVVTVAAARGGGSSEVLVSEFAQAVDLSPMSVVAVQHRGRLKSFDSFARGMMKWVSGARPINGQSATFSYLDLMLRPQAYDKADIIYVKHKDVRRRITRRLANDPTIGPERLLRIQETGLISKDLLARPEVESLLNEMQRDLIRTNKAVGAIRDAQVVSNANTLFNSLTIVPPAGDDAQVSWLPLSALMEGQPPNADPQVKQAVMSAWDQLAVAWAHQDAAAVNTALANFAGQLPRLNEALYPANDKLELESWYFRYKALVWTWMVYLLAIVPLLMAVVYQWKSARRLGLFLFVMAFGLHTASLGIRWYLAGRIPNSNMFEAILAATWFGGAAAVLIEAVISGMELKGRKVGMKNLFALSSAVCSMVAMMCSHFMPVSLSSDIDHVMPVLNDLWLYIHTNVIIFSYCLIGMAAVSAIIYLIYRFLGGDRDYARPGGPAAIMKGAGAGGDFIKAPVATMGQVLDGATMVMMKLSFVLLWAGLVMGAIWADHSWGRPWGWDPKEVFALNTFIIFLILVHVRLKVSDKGLWTAVLACIGCGVMLFNWIVVNFVITGLHSYA